MYKIIRLCDFRVCPLYLPCSRFVNVKVVKALSLLLKDFQKNTAEVNHCIVKLLHRIAVECKMPAMIFQASIFRIFQRIFDSRNPEHKVRKLPSTNSSNSLVGN